MKAPHAIENVFIIIIVFYSYFLEANQIIQADIENLSYMVTWINNGYGSIDIDQGDKNYQTYEETKEAIEKLTKDDFKIFFTFLLSNIGIEIVRHYYPVETCTLHDSINKIFFLSDGIATCVTIESKIQDKDKIKIQDKDKINVLQHYANQMNQFSIILINNIHKEIKFDPLENIKRLEAEENLKQMNIQRNCSIAFGAVCLFLLLFTNLHRIM